MFRKNNFLNNVNNFLSWKTKRKIIVFESDDWGSIGMINKKNYGELLSKGIPVNNSLYSKLDSLEKRQDLDDLFNILKKHKNRDGINPKFTFNVVLSNPNFNEIKKNHYQYFVNEVFIDSYKKYYGENNFDLWSSAIGEKIIKPQFHAREHLNRFLWLNDLKKGNKKTLLAFDYNYFGAGLETSRFLNKNYLATYNASNGNEQNLIKKNLKIGLTEFSEIFGFRSKTFIASNYTWSSDLNKTLKDEKITGIQGQRVQISPNYTENNFKKIRHYTGKRNIYNQIYTVRNTIFEPYSNLKVNWVEKTIKDIDNAFFWNAPSIIVTHRVNYVSNMSKLNKEKNLSLLDSLLKKILVKYPNVEFLTSDELIEEIKKSK